MTRASRSWKSELGRQSNKPGRIERDGFRRASCLAIGALPLVLATFFSFACAGATDDRAGNTLPAFSVKDLDGSGISSETLRGKIVLIDFWATWCPPCRKEIPHFNELYSRHKDQGVLIIGLALDQKSADVATFLQQIPIEYPIAIATPELQQRFGGITVYPTAFLVDRNGQVVKKYLGYTYPEEFDHDVTALLNKPLSGNHSP